MRQNCQFIKEVKGQFQAWAQICSLKRNDCFGQKFQGRGWRDGSVCKVLTGHTRISKTSTHCWVWPHEGGMALGMVAGALITSGESKGPPGHQHSPRFDGRPRLKGIRWRAVDVLSSLCVCAQREQLHILVHIEHTHSLPLNEVKVVGMVWGMGAWLRAISVTSPSSKCMVTGTSVFLWLRDHSSVCSPIIDSCSAVKFSYLHST